MNLTSKLMQPFTKDGATDHLNKHKGVQNKKKNVLKFSLISFFISALELLDGLRKNRKQGSTHHKISAFSIKLLRVLYSKTT